MNFLCYNICCHGCCNNTNYGQKQKLQFSVCFELKYCISFRCTKKIEQKRTHNNGMIGWVCPTLCRCRKLPTGLFIYIQKLLFQWNIQLLMVTSLQSTVDREDVIRFNRQRTVHSLSVRPVTVAQARIFAFSLVLRHCLYCVRCLQIIDGLW